MEKAIVMNPILSGFHPDPSICYANGKYYIVTSTFSYFPGIPIYESEDLVNFNLIGNVLNRPSQLPLLGGGHSGGIFAPTIRYNNGTFYLITTNVTSGGNFIVTTKDPANSWSDPYYLKGADGIDPSLFFDDDGSCYYVGTRPNPEGVKYNGDWYIYVQKIDLDEMKLIGDYKIIWNGALKNAIWPEGPHLYKKDGMYYLLHAEGGTGPNHAISVAKSNHVFGPYQGNPNNPIFTHRMLGWEYPIQNVGHADFVETPDGNWHIVMLATRPQDGYTALGRETFLANVVWENNWPVINKGYGKLYDKHPIETTKKRQVKKSNHFHFYDATLDLRMIGLRLLDNSMYSLTERKEYVRLYMRTISLREQQNPSYLGIRQLHHSFLFEAMAKLTLSQESDTAGVAIVQSNHANLQLVCTLIADSIHISIIKVSKGKEEILKSEQIGIYKTEKEPRMLFKIQKDRNQVSLLYAYDSNEYVMVVEDLDASFLSTECDGGFVGCTIGIYAYGLEGTKGYADYGWLTYEELQ